MRPVSPRFLASLRESHQVVTECELHFRGTIPLAGRAPIATVVVPIVGGSVAMDRNAQIRRSGSVEIPWSLEVGNDLGLDLRQLPLGGYVKLSQGIRYPDASRELVQLGFLRVESVAWRTLEERATLELADRMAQVRDEPFRTPYTATGQRAAVAAENIARQVFGTRIAYQTQYDPAGLLVDTVYPDSKADAIQALADSVNAEAYFDALGNYVFRQVPTGTAVWTVDTGTEGVMVDANEALDRTDVYNGVLVEGQPDSKTAPVIGFVADDNNASPTLWGGPYGRVLRVERNAAVQTVAQATALARSLLARNLGLARSLTLTNAPNPALEPSDTLRVEFADGRAELHVIDSVRLDLGPAGAQTIDTRSYFTPTMTQWTPLPTKERGAYYGEVPYKEAVSV